MENATPVNLFEAAGMELEYVIADRQTLETRPICDQLLMAQAGHITGDIEFDDISWSNELAHHMVEMKTTDPTRPLAFNSGAFQKHVRRMNELLEPLNCRLMPAAMHPWMDANREMNIWPHEYSIVYEMFNHIFGCRGHGWMNIQAMHVNLPFEGDEQFGKLHAAIRLILPILPALAASSPVKDSTITGILDNRLDVYPNNCARIPSIGVRLIPEPVYTIHDYHEVILQRIYRDLEPYDPKGILQYEWSNARGAIARFNRNTIEIRVIDMQECPAADVAVATAAVEVVKLLVAQTWSGLKAQQAWPSDPLADLLKLVVRDGDRTVIANADYLKTFGYTKSSSCTAGELWKHLFEQVARHAPGSLDHCSRELDVMVTQGPLSRRILKALSGDTSRAKLHEVYARLCDCLQEGAMFT